jgi:hypothetical protein
LSYGLYLNFGAFLFKFGNRIAPKNHPTRIPKMKKILTLIAGISIFAACGASAVPTTITQNTTVSANKDGASFTFNQFDTSLGSLSAVNLIINSSIAGGNFTLNRASAGSTSPATYDGLQMTLDVSDLNGSVFTGPVTNITATGNSSIARPSSNLYLVTGVQSLLSSSPTSVPISSGSWSLYEGLGSVALSAGLTNLPLFTQGRNISVPPDNLFANTSVTLQYTYTPGTAPVPEPGQVAASLLLLGGIGAYVFIKRRKKSAPAAV